MKIGIISMVFLVLKCENWNDMGCLGGDSKDETMVYFFSKKVVV